MLYLFSTAIQHLGGAKSAMRGVQGSNTNKINRGRAQAAVWLDELIYSYAKNSHPNRFCSYATLSRLTRIAGVKIQANRVTVIYLGHMILFVMLIQML